mmetsp:Transcript_142873/g.398036  ORF Transcript_142873/g.398036 Transcript_142873/m.398036 type:complete len:423 (+) Transcript_142873:433-1701(+)
MVRDRDRQAGAVAVRDLDLRTQSKVLGGPLRDDPARLWLLQAGYVLSLLHHLPSRRQSATAAIDLPAVEGRHEEIAVAALQRSLHQEFLAKLGEGLGLVLRDDPDGFLEAVHLVPEEDGLLGHEAVVGPHLVVRRLHNSALHHGLGDKALRRVGVEVQEPVVRHVWRDDGIGLELLLDGCRTGVAVDGGRGVLLLWQLGLEEFHLQLHGHEETQPHCGGLRTLPPVQELPHALVHSPFEALLVAARLHVPLQLGPLHLERSKVHLISIPIAILAVPDPTAANMYAIHLHRRRVLCLLIADLQASPCWIPVLLVSALPLVDERRQSKGMQKLFPACQRTADLDPLRDPRSVLLVLDAPVVPLPHGTARLRVLLAPRGRLGLHGRAPGRTEEPVLRRCVLRGRLPSVRGAGSLLHSCVLRAGTL